jgi:hypothetical protein
VRNYLNSQMKDEVFNNTSRRVIRVFFAIAGGFALIGAVPLVLLWAENLRGGASADFRQGCLLMVWIVSPLMLAMVFSALLTIPTARQADREFDQFRRGDLLVRWEYSPEFWGPYVEAETRRLRSVAKVIFWLIFGPAMVMVLYIGSVAARTWHGRIDVYAVAAAVLIVLMGVYIFCARVVVRFRRNALLNCPRAYIGRSAIYCGGIFNFWGSQLRALYSVRLLPGHTAEHPGLLEFVIGMSTGARRTVSIVNAAAMMTMQGGYAPSQSARQVIPIQPGDEARAAEIVALLGTPVHVAPAVHAAPVHIPFRSPAAVAQPTIAMAKKAPALSGVHHDPQLLHRKAVRWFVITIVLLVGGLGMFLLAMPIDSGRPAGSQPSSLATFVEVLGLFAWVFSPATLVMSIVQWFRSRHSAHPMHG